MKKNKIRLMDIRHLGEYVDHSFKLLKYGIKPIFKSFVIFCIPLIVVSSLLYSSFYSPEKLFKTSDSMQDVATTMLTLFLVMLIMYAAMLFLKLISFSYLTIYERVDDPEEITFSYMKSIILKKFFPTLGGYLLYALLLFLGSLGYLLVAGIIVFIFSLFKITALSIGLAVIFYIIYFCLLVYTMIPISLYPMILLREDRGVWDSITRAFKLIKGEWWYTFGMLFIMSIILVFIRMIFQLPLYIMIFSSAYQQSTSAELLYSSNKLLYGGAVFLSQAALFVVIIYNFAIGLKYYHCVEKKEAVTLEGQIEDLELS